MFGDFYMYMYMYTYGQVHVYGMYYMYNVFGDFSRFIFWELGFDSVENLWLQLNLC